MCRHGTRKPPRSRSRGCACQQWHEPCEELQGTWVVYVGGKKHGADSELYIGAVSHDPLKIDQVHVYASVAKIIYSLQRFPVGLLPKFIWQAC